MLTKKCAGGSFAGDAEDGALNPESAGRHEPAGLKDESVRPKFVSAICSWVLEGEAGQVAPTQKVALMFQLEHFVQLVMCARM